MDILVKDMEPARILDIFDKAGVRFNENGEAIKFEIFHNDVKPVRHGRWERPEEPSWTVNSACRCQICGWIVSYTQSKAFAYCPNCGAKMDGEEQEHE